MHKLPIFFTAPQLLPKNAHEWKMRSTRLLSRKAQLLSRLPLLLLLQQRFGLLPHTDPLSSIHSRIRQPAPHLRVSVVILSRLLMRILAPLLIQLLFSRRARPHKRTLQLHSHLLDGAGAEPPLDLHLWGVGFALGDFLLLDVAADADDADVVGVVEVVAEVELVHVQGDDEFCE